MKHTTFVRNWRHVLLLRPAQLGEVCMRIGVVAALSAFVLVGYGARVSVAAGSDELGVHLPPDYRQVIAHIIKTEPDFRGMSIRDAQISNPVMHFGAILHGGRVASVCVRYKARDVIDEEFTFIQRRLSEPTWQNRRSTAMLFCNSGRSYVPFPEINKH